MFTTSDRDRVRDRILQLANADARIVAGAVVGSLADGDGDRWSDLDLTFGVIDSEPVAAVLDDFTRHVAVEFEAVHLFDLPSGSTIYRVFLLPGVLQLDLSFGPASTFGAIGPKFRLLFGQAVEKPQVEPPAASQLFGYAVHHAVRARFCIERGAFWQAEYWVSTLRDHALSLACRRRGLAAYYGRGFDDLPDSARESSRRALVRSLDRRELLRALEEAIGLLLRESGEVQDAAARLEPHLRELVGASLQ